MARFETAPTRPVLGPALTRSRLYKIFEMSRIRFSVVRARLSPKRSRIYKIYKIFRILSGAV